MPRLGSIALLAFLAIAGAPGEARELHWRELAVTARLDAEGRLHVRERHAMVFTGHWNGGERTFSLRTGQRLELHAIERHDPERGVIALVRGDLERLDAWDWSAGRTARWRSRLPSDLPFDRTEIVYLLDYTLSNILQPDGDGYWLDHDFAFTDREGVIERFTLDLELAPQWRAPSAFDGRREVAALEPGEGVLVSTELAYTGDGRPAGVTAPISDAWRHLALLAALGAMLVLFLRFRRRERGLGRFDPPPTPPRLDPGFIQEHVLSWRPEEIGALWDERVGPPEVAALIARLVGEGRLESSLRRAGRFFKRSVLELRLMPGAADFDGYETKLVGKLFFNRRLKVDTDDIRAHYRNSGFDPAGVIRPGLERAVKERLGKSAAPRKPSARRTLLLFLGAAAAAAIELVLRPEVSVSWLLLAAAGWLVLFWSGFAAAGRWQLALSGLDRRQLYWILPAVALALLYWWLPTFLASVNPALAPRYLGTLALGLIAVGTFSSLVHRASTRVPAKRLAQRRRLAIVRDWWREELASASPELDDALLPYLIAFGLERRVDRWFRAHGGSVAGSPSRPGTGAGSPSVGGGGSWTGGGGTFGGAGASATWAAAAASLAGGVSAARSSSGGSSGGGGGGGSSGGGGGGGW